MDEKSSFLSDSGIKSAFVCRWNEVENEAANAFVLGTWGQDGLVTLVQVSQTCNKNVAFELTLGRHLSSKPIIFQWLDQPVILSVHLASVLRIVDIPRAHARAALKMSSPSTAKLLNAFLTRSRLMAIFSLIVVYVCLFQSYVHQIRRTNKNHVAGQSRIRFPNIKLL